MTEYEKLQQKIEVWIEENKKQMIQDAIELVKIKSVSQKGENGYPYGAGCARVLELALQIAGEMGFETQNCEYYFGTVLLKGETERQLGIFGHLDVVPEGDLSNWDFNPYEAKLQDGYVIGRGSSDNKCPAVASLYALKCIRDLKIPINHSILMFFGCDEESGMSDIVQFLEHHEAPEISFTSDGRYSLCYGEKGILTADLEADISGSNLEEFYGGQASNMVPDYARAVIKGIEPKHLLTKEEAVRISRGEGGKIVVEASGIAAHAAFPEGSESAIQKLATALISMGILDEKAENAMRLLAEGFRDYYGTGLEIESEDEIVGKTTAVGGKAYIKDGKLIQSLNVRYALKADQEKMISNLMKVCKKYEVVVKRLKNDPPMYIDPKTEWVQVLHETANEFLDGTYKPYVMGGEHMQENFPMQWRMVLRHGNLTHRIL